MNNERMRKRRQRYQYLHLTLSGKRDQDLLFYLKAFPSGLRNRALKALAKRGLEIEGRKTNERKKEREKDFA